jgi:hypothetical protein
MTKNIYIKLQFNSDCSVGFAFLYYPHTWPILGTTKQQSVIILWKTREKDILYQGNQKLASKLRGILFDHGYMQHVIGAKAKSLLYEIKKSNFKMGNAQQMIFEKSLNLFTMTKK